MQTRAALGAHGRWRLSCAGALGVCGLALCAALALSLSALRAPAGAPPARPRVHSFSLGPVRLMSGVTAFDACAAMGVLADSWRCPSTYSSRPPGQPAAFRVWIFVTSARDGVRAYQLVDVALEDLPR